MKITDALVVEHRILLNMFDQVERMLPAVATIPEMGRIATLLEVLLREHGDAEANLAYLALDQVLAERAQLDSMHHDHREIDARLKRVQAAPDCAAARDLLRAALNASREHFRVEAACLFPLLERVLQRDTLTDLGRSWLTRRTPGVNTPLLRAQVRDEIAAS